MQTKYDAAVRAADTGVAVAAGSFTASLAIASEILQIVAFLVTIIAGTAAAIFHIKRTIALSREE